MRINLLCVGGVRGPLTSALQEYEERARAYWRFRVAEVPAGAGRGRRGGEEEVRRAEEERLLNRLPAGPGEVVALTREGNPMDSRRLAELLGEWGVRSMPDVTFVIGGAFGLGQGILSRSTRRLSLSAMTLPHEMARLLLAEQLYRAGTILRNEPYHKGP